MSFIRHLCERTIPDVLLVVWCLGELWRWLEYTAEHPALLALVLTIPVGKGLAHTGRALARRVRHATQPELPLVCRLAGHDYRLEPPAVPATHVSPTAYAVVYLWTCRRCPATVVQGGVIEVRRAVAPQLAAVMGLPDPRG